MERWITARLYVADERTRLSQYVLLGVGGMRALRALGIEPSVVHLNEGHAALAPLELACEAARSGERWRARSRRPGRGPCSRPTRPVPAGNDSYPAAEVEAAIGRLMSASPCPVAEASRSVAPTPTTAASRSGSRRRRCG